MTLYAVWPYFVLVFVVSIACGRLPPFKLVDDARAGAGMRTETLDGLRGFLALSVFIHHFVITHRYLQSGIWDYPPSAFYTLLGQVGFGVFFMITGFLFWGKLLDARGRPDWWPLDLGARLSNRTDVCTGGRADAVRGGVPGRFPTSAAPCNGLHLRVRMACAGRF